MKTFVITWDTNYGEMVIVANFEDFSVVDDFASNDERIWSGYKIEELSTERGVVFFGGGDN